MKKEDFLQEDFLKQFKNVEEMELFLKELEFLPLHGQ